MTYRVTIKGPFNHLPSLPGLGKHKPVISERVALPIQTIRSLTQLPLTAASLKTSAKIFTTPAKPLIARPFYATGGKEGLFDADIRHLLRQTEVKYGFYSQDHPFIKYTNSLADRLKSDDNPLRVLVTKSWDEENAFALPDGTIVVSDRLIPFCEFEETLLAVLGHEYNHAIRNHSAKRMDLLKNAAGGLDTYLRQIAQERFHEYEADVRGGLTVNQSGQNPYGSFILFKKLHAQKHEKDAAHGSALDRLINLNYMTHLIDLKALTTDLTPIPRYILDISVHEMKTDYQILETEPVNKDNTIAVEREEAAKRAGLHTLLATISLMAARIENASQHTLGGHLTELQIRAESKVLKLALKRIKTLIDAEFSKATKKEKDFVFFVALTSSGIDLFEATDPSHPFYDIVDTFVGHLDTPSDFKVLEQILTPQKLDRLGISFVGNPTSFLTHLCTTALEAELFHKKDQFDLKTYVRFYKNWINQLDALNPVFFSNINRVRRIEKNLIRLARDEIEGIIELSAAEVYLENWKSDQNNAIKSFVEEHQHDSPQTLLSLCHDIFELVPTTADEKLFEELFDAILKDPSFTKMGASYSIDRFNVAITSIKDDYAQNIKIAEALDNAISRGVMSPACHLFTTQFISEITHMISKIDSDGQLGRLFDDTIQFGLGNAFDHIPKEEFMRLFAEIGQRAGFLKDTADPIVLLNRIFNDYTFDLSQSPDRQFLYRVSFLIGNPIIGLRLRDEITKRILAGDDEEAFRFLFVDEKAAPKIRGSTLENFINSRITRLDQLERLKKEALAQIDTFDPEVSQGQLVIMDLLEKNARGKKNLFKMLMETSRSDHELKELIFTVIDEVEYFTKSENHPGTASKLYQTDSTIESLYLMEGLGIHAVVRSLLVGEKGLLTAGLHRKWLIDYLLKDFILEEAGESKVLDILKVGLEEIMGQADIESLFVAIAPLIEGRILRPPPQPTDWADMWDDLPLGGEAKTKTLQNYKKLKLGQLSLADRFKLNDGTVAEYEPKVLALIGDHKPAHQEAKMTPVQMTVAIAKNLGSIGVRFLQVMGQFINIPPEHEEDFSQVYDGMNGQSKLTAYLLLQRERPGLAQEIAEIRKPLGGGSLMTTFHAVTVDGKDKALKILNPNAEYHVETVYKLLAKVLDSLAKKKGGTYATARKALDNIREWILGDIRFEGFAAKDRAFYEQNHGFKLAGIDAGIKVPVSEGVESKYYKEEEFIPGHNLTRLTELAQEGRDVRPMITLLLRNYLHQVQQGLVHSDAHPGNFRVTPEGDVAILDRNFFLQMDRRDLSFLMQAFVAGTNTQSLAKAACNYFGIESASLRTDIEDYLESLQETGPVEKVHKLILFFNRTNIDVPLKITLFLKNLNALSRMAQSVGFKDLQEAIR